MGRRGSTTIRTTCSADMNTAAPKTGNARNKASHWRTVTRGISPAQRNLADQMPSSRDRVAPSNKSPGDSEAEITSQKAKIAVLAPSTRETRELVPHGPRVSCRTGVPLACMLWTPAAPWRSEEHTSELQSLRRTSYAVFCLKKKK